MVLHLEVKGKKHSTSCWLLCLLGAWFPEHARLGKHLHVLYLAKVQRADFSPAELHAAPKDEVVSPKSPYAPSICKKERAGKRDCYSQPAQPLPDKSDAAAAGMGCFGTPGLIVRAPTTKHAHACGIFNLQFNCKGFLRSLNGNCCA